VRVALVAVAAVLLAVPAASHGAVKSGIDRRAGMRLKLDGRVLTAEIVRTPHFHRDPTTEEEVHGRRIDAICAVDAGSYVHRTRRWPPGVRSVSFRFRRDLSRRAVWCLLEHRARDVAFVSFIERGPFRFVAKGRSPSGDWWRLAGRRGPAAEPCALLRMPEWGSRPCFFELLGRRTDFGVRRFAPCERDVFVFGVAARAWQAVRVVLVDGTRVDATLHAPPRRSRVRQRYFIAALPEGTDARAVEATKPGELLRRPLGRYSSAPCAP
jgi:hypothetical protein